VEATVEELMEKPAFPLKVFYDGACIVCATEMQIYRRKDHGGRLVFIDISAPGFDPVPYGITREEFMRQMYAIDREGTVFRAIDAFRAIWQAFPASTFYGVLGALIAFPGITAVARMGYRLFARYRKYLPRRRRDCASGTCSIRNGP
jgi:predicted DCC family thiol-disulfide oxidoreductase YuxK